MIENSEFLRQIADFAVIYIRNIYIHTYIYVFALGECEYVCACVRLRVLFRNGAA